MRQAEGKYTFGCLVDKHTLIALAEALDTHALSPRRILSAELAAVCGLIDESVKPGDCVLVFQKDAYMALRKPDASAYDVSLLQRAEIVSEYIRGSVELVCVPPTRFLYSRVTRSVLAALVQRANGSAGVADEGLAAPDDRGAQPPGDRGDGAG